MELTKDNLLKMYFIMKLARGFEERVSTLYKQGKILGGIFSGIGQEAIVVGTAFGLKAGDAVLPLHRDLGVFLARGLDPKILMAQIFGKEAGLSKGKDSYLHSAAPELGIYGATSMLASSLPVAAGMALAFKIDQKESIAVAYIGEGATSRGDFHEALNFAGVHKLPVIFVCENNFYAFSTPLEKQMAVEDVADRAAGYGFPGRVCSGNDVLAVWHVMEQAEERARKGEGPTLIECKTYRWHGHSEHDRAYYRTEEEFVEWKSRDPIPRFELYLRERQMLDDDVQKDVQERVDRDIEEAVEFAEQSPYPPPEEALEDVYTPGGSA